LFILNHNNWRTVGARAFVIEISIKSNFKILFLTLVSNFTCYNNTSNINIFTVGHKSSVHFGPSYNFKLLIIIILFQTLPKLYCTCTASIAYSIRVLELYITMHTAQCTVHTVHCTVYNDRIRSTQFDTRFKAIKAHSSIA